MFYKALLALGFVLVAGPALAQNTTCSDRPITDSSNACANTRFVDKAIATRPSTPGGTNGQIQFNNNGSLGGFTANGDATINTNTGGVNVTSIRGVPVNTTGSAANDVLAYNGTSYVHTAFTTLINTLCSLSPNTCVLFFGYGDPTWWGGSIANADNSAAINTALTNATQVRIPGSGTWLIRSSIVMNPSNVLNCPAGAVIMQGNSAGLISILNFYTTTANGSIVDGCVIDGNRANNTDSDSFIGVNISTTASVTIRNSTIQNMPGNCLSVAGQYPWFHHNKMSNCYQIGFGLVAVSPGYPMYGKVTDNVITGTMAHPIYTYQADHVEIYNNTINTPIAIGGAYGSIITSTMYVTITASNATWVSGTDFTGAVAGQFIVVGGGNEYQISKVNSNTSLTLHCAPSCTPTFSNQPAAIGNGDQISLNSVSYGITQRNNITGGVTGGVVLSNESASTQNADDNIISGNYVFDPGSYCYVIDGNGSFTGSVNNTQLVNNHCLNPGRAGNAGQASGGIELYAAAGKVNGAIIDGNSIIDSFNLTGNYWLTSFGQNNAVNVFFGVNEAKGFAYNGQMNGYPTFASLPVGAVNYYSGIIDGNAANCGDGTCTTWGTIVTSGGGSIPLFLWNRGSGWTLVGK